MVTASPDPESVPPEPMPGPDTLNAAPAPTRGGGVVWTRVVTLVLAWGFTVSMAYLSLARLGARDAKGRLAMDIYLALATLALLLAAMGWWTWTSVSRRQLARRRTRGDSQWAIAARHFRKNRLAIGGMGVMILLYVVTLLTPLIAPYHPAAQGDITTSRYLEPFWSRGGTAEGGGRFAKGAQARVVAHPRPGYRFAGWMRDGSSVSTDTLFHFRVDTTTTLVARFIPADSAVQAAESAAAAWGAQAAAPAQPPAAPAAAPGGPEYELRVAVAPPHLMGTDKFGRDIFSRVLYGARISLSIGFVAVAISITLGTLIGALAGYFGGWVDAVLMRFTDMMLAFPRLVLLIVVIAVFQTQTIWLVVVVLGLTGWMGTSRIVRGEVLSLREREFVQAARALGMGDWRIILRHVIPNTMAPVIVSATLGIGLTILTEASLSFLGLGVQPPTPSWGNMVADGRDALVQAWWIATFPGLAIVLTVVAFNLLGDGLRDALDPRLRT